MGVCPKASWAGEHSPVKLSLRKQMVPAYCVLISTVPLFPTFWSAHFPAAKLLPVYPAGFRIGGRTLVLPDGIIRIDDHGGGSAGPQPPDPVFKKKLGDSCLRGGMTGIAHIPTMHTAEHLCHSCIVVQ